MSGWGLVVAAGAAGGLLGLVTWVMVSGWADDEGGSWDEEGW